MNTDACKPVGEGADAPAVSLWKETIDEYGPSVRVRHTVDEAIVEELRCGAWTQVLSFNLITDDYALTHARGTARRLQMKQKVGG